MNTYIAIVLVYLDPERQTGESWAEESQALVLCTADSKESARRELIHEAQRRGQCVSRFLFIKEWHDVV